MNKWIVSIAGAVLASLPLLACSSAAGERTDPEVDDETAEGTSATSSDAVSGRTCYCSGDYACGRSRSTSYMFPRARTALSAAGVSTDELTQTFGDATASVGTHCPEPGLAYSAATDIAASDSPCTRTRRLRLQGFAAWYRTAPEFTGNVHIHAVYAGGYGLKGSLVRQIDSFLDGRDGLRSNNYDYHCPITEQEKEAVRDARAGRSTSNGTTSAGTTGGCHPGGLYCGGNKVSGDASSLYRCTSGSSGELVERCSSGCSVNPGANDSCD